MRVDQVITGAGPGDAVTESALRIRDALREVVESDVFAWHIHPEMAGTIPSIERYPARARHGRHDVLVYHITIGQPEVTEFILGRPERLVAVYHNITPASYFDGADPFAELLQHGRSMLPRVLTRAHHVIADSEFNAAEVRALGFRDVSVVPPPVDIERLLGTPSDPHMERTLAESVPGELVLFVGQPLPHKRPDLLIAAFNVLSTNTFPNARLVLVGPRHGRTYEEALRRYVEELNLDSVWFMEGLTDAELAALYRRADLFTTASEHEGLCVPIIEAFSFGVPVVARGFGAVPDTADGAALVLPPDSGARELAEAMGRVLGDAVLRDYMVTAGRRRAARFGLERTLPDMLGVILDALRLPVEAT